MEDFRRAIEINPKLVSAHNNLGVARFNLRDYKGAIADYTRAIELRPNDAGAHSRRAAAYHKLGDLKRSLADYDKAIKAQPKYASAHNNRGAILYDLGELDRALADFDRAIALRPSYLPAYRNRGNLLTDRGDYLRAIKDFDRAIEGTPDYAAAYNKRGRVWFYHGDFAKAAADLRIALQKAPNSPYYALWLYLAQVRAGDPYAQAALAANAKRLDLAGWPEPVFRFLLGQIDEQALYAAAGNGDAATIKEQTCEVNFYAGQMGLMTGERARARRLFDKAKRNCLPSYIEYKGAQVEFDRMLKKKERSK